MKRPNQLPPAPAMRRGLLAWLLIWLLAAGFSTAHAQVPDEATLEGWRSDIGAIQKTFENSLLTDADIKRARQTASETGRSAWTCIEDVRTEVDRIKALVGEPNTETPAAENEPAEQSRPPADTAQDPTPVDRKVDSLETVLTACQEIALAADGVERSVEAIRAERIVQKLETRGRTLSESIDEAFSESHRWSLALHPFARLAAIERAVGTLEWLVILGLGLAGVGVGFGLRHGALSGAAVAPVFLGLVGALAGATMVFGADDIALLPILWQFVAVIALVLLAELLPPIEEVGAHLLSGWTLGAFLISALAVWHIFHLYGTGPTVPAAELIRMVGFVVLAVLAMPATRYVRSLLLLGRAWKLLRVVFLAGIAAALLTEIMGYRLIAFMLLRGFVGSLVAIVLYSLVQRANDALIAEFENGDAAWAHHLRRSISVNKGESIPGLFWLRLLLEIFMFGGFVLGVASAWGLEEAGRQAALRYAVDGFTLWGVTFIPARIIGGILVFSLLLMLGRRVRGLAERRWLSRTRIAPGGRDALLTLMGYAAVLIAIVAGLSWAGIGFENIALVAGALSVGIGFGLQNIVSNFVSGLILLFERPIRAGDWVIVGGTEGIVRKISVRATQIQTFDRTEVIVPNADLIQGQVTNYTLSNNTGRAVVRVGVAYGSDTELVRKLLIDIATSQPGVLTDGVEAPTPLVTFSGFGDSSLDFVLRAWISDVNKRIVIISDINFAIDKAFREHDIEIPFPQRDVHVRNLPPPAEAETG